MANVTARQIMAGRAKELNARAITAIMKVIILLTFLLFTKSAEVRHHDANHHDSGGNGHACHCPAASGEGEKLLTEEVEKPPPWPLS